MSASDVLSRVGSGLAAAGSWVVAWAQAHPVPAACILCVIGGVAIGLWM